jgi:DegV family protein with EDD domain
MTIKVVTDSTADLSGDLVEELDITVVPLNVHFGTESFKDGIEIKSEEFYSRLAEGPIHPATSQPSPGDFIEIYNQIGKDADGIVSIHVSEKLSGTYNSAMQAKGNTDVDCQIEVIDSTQVSLALGLAVVAAAETAKKGGDIGAVAEAARDTASRTEIFCLLPTLEYLEKGGRIGKAKSMLGTVLNVKPMMKVKDGEVHELGKVRTFKKGIVKLKEITRNYSSIESLYVLHTTTPELAQEIANELRDCLPGGESPNIGSIGPTVGTHGGPGLIGIALLAKAL